MAEPFLIGEKFQLPTHLTIPIMIPRAILLFWHTTLHLVTRFHAMYDVHIGSSSEKF